ncbi:MAG TPA: aminotransferase class I/II-fold pyridoxal phosphate-dependent enzyme [Thermoanaerobaculia bacterium]|nr:aminotransferase class I/II-fold pyridoxal phosphate-dependent enzyme [Thermoanaerobaculia bacterium]
MKAQSVELAVFGGPPAFAEPLHVGRPNVGDRGRLLARINDLLDRRWLTNHGPYVEELEGRIASLVGARHCIAMCNGTVALEIAARALGLSGEVIVPSFTFVATAHALRWQEVTPVFCDIDPRTCNLDPGRVEELITPRTTGIVGVHLWGRPCDADALRDIARRRGLRLLFDAAHAFGCSYRGRMVGTLGDAEVFSFHATKFLNSFEGGAVLTDDDALAAKIRLMKNFGFAGYDEVIHLGINGKMSEVAAAMGLTSLESMDEFIAVNRRNYHRYREELADLPGLRLVEYDESERCNYQYIVLDVDRTLTGLSRDALQIVLQAENVFARRYFHPGCHRMEPYRSEAPPDVGLRLPETERLAGRVLSLPTGTAVGPEHIREIVRILRLALAHAAEIRERIAA